MRVSETLIPTLREDPGEAETVSHRFMLRAGMIRKVAAGIYTYLPLGLRVLRKIECIVREEMNRAGAQEVLMPVASPPNFGAKRDAGTSTAKNSSASKIATNGISAWDRRMRK